MSTCIDCGVDVVTEYPRCASCGESRLSALASKMAGIPLTVVAVDTVKLPTQETHDERAARLYAGNFISRACASTPCLPCDGHVVRDDGKGPQEQLCVCSCHNP